MVVSARVEPLLNVPFIGAIYMLEDVVRTATDCLSAGVPIQDIGEHISFGVAQVPLQDLANGVSILLAQAQVHQDHVEDRIQQEVTLRVRAERAARLAAARQAELLYSHHHIIKYIFLISMINY